MTPSDILKELQGIYFLANDQERTLVLTISRIHPYYVHDCNNNDWISVMFGLGYYARYSDHE